MALETTATFIGHNECFGLSAEKLKNTIRELIKKGVTDFLSGGQGGFDRLCGRCVYELKKEYPHINNYVLQVNGSRVVIDKSEDGKNAICSPVKAADLQLVTGGTQAYRTYTVVKGDTLWGIAKTYLGSGARYTEIVKLNGLKSSVIYAGQKLKLPQH